MKLNFKGKQDYNQRKYFINSFSLIFLIFTMFFIQDKHNSALVIYIILYRDLITSNQYLMYKLNFNI